MSKYIAYLSDGPQGHNTRKLSIQADNITQAKQLATQDANGDYVRIIPAPKIPVDSIRIPSEYADLCPAWHGGLGCLMYAVASTGGLTLGTDRPRDDEGEWMRDEEWYASLFSELSSDIGAAVRLAELSTTSGDFADELDTLRNFEVWADAMREELAESYGLED